MLNATNVSENLYTLSFKRNKNCKTKITILDRINLSMAIPKWRYSLQIWLCSQIIEINWTLRLLLLYFALIFIIKMRFFMRFFFLCFYNLQILKSVLTISKIYFFNLNVSLKIWNEGTPLQKALHISKKKKIYYYNIIWFITKKYYT